MMQSKSLLCFTLMIVFPLHIVIASPLYRLGSLLKNDGSMKKDQLGYSIERESRRSLQSLPQSLFVPDDDIRQRAVESEEDHYFRWAIANRRPMESLAGRKRDTDFKLVGSSDGSAFKNLWRSGLVG